MSRGLDALFAERVLGWERSSQGINWCENGEPVAMASGPINRFCPTKSLDAAWAGVEKIGKNDFCLERFASWWRASVNPSATHEEFVVDDTPALALVKACLLAVGVTQKEIDDAEACKEDEEEEKAEAG